jgi:hypothetical protein
MDQFLVRYQDPKQADALTKIQAELDETKIIMVCNISIKPLNRTRADFYFLFPVA